MPGEPPHAETRAVLAFYYPSTRPQLLGTIFPFSALMLTRQAPRQGPAVARGRGASRSGVASSRMPATAIAMPRARQAGEPPHAAVRAAGREAGRHRPGREHPGDEVLSV